MIETYKLIENLIIKDKNGFNHTIIKLTASNNLFGGTNIEFIETDITSITNLAVINLFLSTSTIEGYKDLKLGIIKIGDTIQSKISNDKYIVKNIIIDTDYRGQKYPTFECQMEGYSIICEINLNDFSNEYLEICNKTSVIVNPHLNHEIVDNMAMGKPFKYCRKCKEEVV